MDYYFTEDLLVIIFVRLPLKSITAFTSVCKQWKSILESQFFRELFLSYHKNSHSSWSLMCRDSPKEVMAYFGCKIWGLQRSPGSYISSFITEKFETRKEHSTIRVEAHTDVGFILISLANKISGHITYYVANPISRQCVQIPPHSHPPPSRTGFFRDFGLATRIENGVVLGYKVVFMDKSNFAAPKLHIYSSETGLWSINTLHPHFPLPGVDFCDTVSLNGHLYWVIYNLNNEVVVVSHDFYASGTESDRYGVILFPDVEKHVLWRRVCTTSQGFLMYMNTVDEITDRKFRVWKLKSGEWQLVYEIYLNCREYFPLAINPFDDTSMYLRSKMHKCLVFANFQKGKLWIDNNFEHSSHGNILSFAGEWNPFENQFDRYFIPFVLPRWLHRIPS